MKYALQTTVLSLSALRRLRFPTKKKKNGIGAIQSPETDLTARTVLAALGLVAITAQRERDYFLRSRCELRAVDAPPFEFVAQGREMADENKFTLTFDGAIELLIAALAVKGGPTWKSQAKMPKLKPKANLAELIRLSHERGGAEDEEQEQPAGTND